MSINASKLPAYKWNGWVLKQTREHSTPYGELAGTELDIYMRK
jgi:hypothetical protein